MKRTESIITKIEELEVQLQQLRIELEVLNKDTNHQEVKEDLKLGNEVVILNPKLGQERFGTVNKYNHNTGYVTIKTRKGKVIRKKDNVLRK